MAAKTANVTARIQPNIKEQAEAILERLGIPVSVFIDMTYRQVIMRDGIPFSLPLILFNFFNLKFIFMLSFLI